MSDSSYWFLFYNFATDYSGTGGYYYQSTLQDLKKLGKKINLIEGEVTEEELSNYLESNQVRKLVTKNQELSQSNDSLKGGLFELFVAHLLSKMGFETQLRYRNSKLLGKSEIDVIAIKQLLNKKAKMVIVEAFGSFPIDPFYIAKIRKEMEKKLSIVRNNYGEILSEGGVQYLTNTAPTVELWIATYDTTRKRRLCPGVYVYDKNKLVDMCKQFNVNYNDFTEFLTKRKQTFIDY
jgi:hypothetical protein